MRVPFQRLLFVARKDTATRNLIGASGGSVHVFDAASGKRLSRWTDPSLNTSNDRPAKKRKINERDDEPAKGLHAQTIKAAQSLNGIQRDTVQGGSFITSVTGTSDGRTLIATTAEDKLVYVFALSDVGVISQLSRRQMAKRPCAIALTPDERNIICADRHGDVYSLPLMWDQDAWDAGKTERLKSPERRRRLAADHTTVHSKKNLQALEHQEKQKKEENADPREPAMDFEHDLLLGHVSMLTDVAVAEIEVSDKKRCYILTADRDEHIRLSRAPPQSYVIEGFLLEHEELVNKLHVPCWDHKILVSGGGDDEVLVWDWLENRIRHRLDVKSHVEKARINYTEDCPALRGHPTKVMVTGIWSLEVSACQMLFVSSEAVPALVVYRRTKDATAIEYLQTLQTRSNVLDLSCCDDGTVLVSTDHLHTPWSRDQRAADNDSRAASLVSFRYDRSAGEWTELQDSILAKGMSEEAKGEDFEEISELKRMESFLYGCEQLRKRRHAESDAASEHGVEESTID